MRNNVAESPKAWCTRICKWTAFTFLLCFVQLAQSVDPVKALNPFRLQHAAIVASSIESMQCERANEKTCVIFICGAGPVNIEDCIKDIARIKRVTKLPVQFFIPDLLISGTVPEEFFGIKVPADLQGYHTLRRYNEENYQSLKRSIHTINSARSETHFIFVVNSQGWVPFRRLAAELHQLGIKEGRFDIILNQPAGKWASGFWKTQARSDEVGTDWLPIMARFLIIVKGTDEDTAASFDQPIFLDSLKYKVTSGLFVLQYGPLTDASCSDGGWTCKRWIPSLSLVDKHGRATGLFLENEILPILQLLAREDGSDETFTRIKIELELGARLRQEFYAAAIQQRRDYIVPSAQFAYAPDFIALRGGADGCFGRRSPTDTRGIKLCPPQHRAPLLVCPDGSTPPCVRFQFPVFTNVVCPNGSPPPCEGDNNIIDDGDKRRCPDGSLPPCKENVGTASDNSDKCSDGSTPPCKDDNNRSKIRVDPASIHIPIFLRYNFVPTKSVVPFLFYEPQVSDTVIISK